MLTGRVLSLFTMKNINAHFKEGQDRPNICQMNTSFKLCPVKKEICIHQYSFSQVHSSVFLRNFRPTKYVTYVNKFLNH